MKILVTGHKGFIGQNMMKALLADNHEVVGYEWGDREYNLNGIDRVIHLGAITSTTCTDAKALLRQNYYFTELLLHRCSSKEIPIQIASSASVYGPHNTTFVETDFPDPSNFYAWSKFLIEEMVNTHEYPMPIHLFRYFNVYGPYEEHKGSQASPFTQFRKQALETGYIKVFEGSENFRRDFVHVEQVIDTHKRFFNVTDTGVWNVGTGHTRSFMDVAEEVATDITGAVIETIPMPDNLKNSYQSFTKADLTKLNGTLKKYET